MPRLSDLSLAEIVTIEIELEERLNQLFERYYPHRFKTSIDDSGELQVVTRNLLDGATHGEINRALVIFFGERGIEFDDGDYEITDGPEGYLLYRILLAQEENEQEGEEDDAAAAHGGGGGDGDFVVQVFDNNINIWLIEPFPIRPLGGSDSPINWL